MSSEVTADTCLEKISQFEKYMFFLLRPLNKITSKDFKNLILFNHILHDLWDGHYSIHTDISHLYENMKGYQ